jgi:phospholipid transport system substrate-binding protein
MDRMFDWTAMAEASLQRHWQKLTAVERSEFTRLFADVFARAYVAQMHLVDNRTFQYLGETTLGDRGTVKTSVFTRRGKPIDVEYVVRPTPAGRWHVHDVRVETISLVDNYRVQFDSILSRSSYDELVKRLRTATR